MGLQYVNIKDSQVKFVNENNDPNKKIQTVEADMATLVFESMQDKLEINQLETELGNALIEIMTLKMGGNA